MLVTVEPAKYVAVPGVPGRCRGCSRVPKEAKCFLTVACETQVLAGLNDVLIVIESMLQP